MILLTYFFMVQGPLDAETAEEALRNETKCHKIHGLGNCSETLSTHIGWVIER
jgi:hypothetical protein